MEKRWNDPVINNGLPLDIKLSQIRLGSVVEVQFEDADNEKVVITYIEKRSPLYKGEFSLRGITRSLTEIQFEQTQIVSLSDKTISDIL
jgi:hypothetical protein